ncbi:MAG: hypothetical protein V2A74_03590, partial [bacterium]
MGVGEVVTRAGLKLRARARNGRVSFRQKMLVELQGRQSYSYVQQPVSAYAKPQEGLPRRDVEAAWRVEPAQPRSARALRASVAPRKL